MGTVYSGLGLAYPWLAGPGLGVLWVPRSFTKTKGEKVDANDDFGTVVDGCGCVNGCVSVDRHERESLC